jgi:predicted GH43/DUF377 family glycosyl hydrolase
MNHYEVDFIIFGPDDVDLSRSPLRSLRAETYVLGAFNPGFTRLPNGNLLMMVRVAEALREPVQDQSIHAIRWDAEEGFRLDAYPVSQVNATDPRKFQVLGYPSRVMALTSLSWLLPVELSPDGRSVVTIHYDAAIAPARTYQEYGVEDPRISRIDGTYYMTTCSVSAERHSTTLYTSTDGLHYTLQGIILDHQNKDMLLFEGRPGGKFHALTRPLGDLYFAYPPDSPYQPGPSINLATSPDALHWKPVDTPLIRARKGSTSAMKIGGGTQPILTPSGWLLLYHGVEPASAVGVYRTFWALLDAEDPSRVIHIEDEKPLLEPRADLTAPYKDQMYLSDVVFSTGIIAEGENYIVASGEADLLCRITVIPQSVFG